MGEPIEAIKVWTAVIVSQYFCYTIKSIVPKGLKRFLLLLPVIGLFLYLPFRLTTVHIGCTTAFFISWLANFKLLLLAFDQGPLSSHLSDSFPLFVAIACLPVILPNAADKTIKISKWPRLFVVKIALAILFVRFFHYTESLHDRLVKTMYGIFMYLLLEIILAVATNLIRSVMGLELDPPINEPYLATSLQDFWGRRWNIVVSHILRPVVYQPVLRVATLFVRRSLATVLGVISTFAVSGLMHEFTFYHLGRAPPTGELSCFFLLHGVCVAAEVTAKRWAGERIKLHPVVSRALTIGFVVATANWLFIPQFSKLKIDDRALEEYAVVGKWFSHLVSSIFSPLT